MPEHDRNPGHPLDHLLAMEAIHALDSRRLAFASARASDHVERELYFLELASDAPDDDSARQLEIYADTAYRDALAIVSEHELDFS
jgi:hypothetical protein